MSRLLFGDCLEVMATLPAASVDMVLCDLPYGTTRNKWDAVIPFAPLWREYARLCKPNAAIVLTASQPFTSALLMSAPHLFQCEWIWEKNKASGHLNAKRVPMKSHESVLVFSFGTPVYRPQMTDGHAPGNKALRTNHGDNYGAAGPSEWGGSTSRYPKSVQRFAVVNNDSPDRFHPTQKPVELMEYLIQTYSAEGQMILDNAAGSGTTFIAARNTGRQCIAIENDLQNFTNAARRIMAVRK